MRISTRDDRARPEVNDHCDTKIREQGVGRRHRKTNIISLDEEFKTSEGDPGMKHL